MQTTGARPTDVSSLCHAPSSYHVDGMGADVPAGQSCSFENADHRFHLDVLTRNVVKLETTAEQLLQLLQQAGSASQQQHPVDEQQLQPCSQGKQGSLNSSSKQSSCLVQELQHQLAAVQAEKQRVEADRQEMAVKQGNYKGTIAQLEGALSFTERKVKDQLATIEQLQAHVSTLTSQLQQARGAATLTPVRCRTAARVLQEEADRAASHAFQKEAQVKKLKQIVQLGARELSELLDFAEQERLTLLEKEQALQQDINQTRERLVAVESNAADAVAGAAALQQQLELATAELQACQARMHELEMLLESAQCRLQQSESRFRVLAAERDAVARNLVTAEAELNDVGEYSTKMFRQVRFISHMLDKNSTVLSKLPDFAVLARDLRAFVAANVSHWERRGTGLAALIEAAGSPSQVNGASQLADTAVSGSRDVLGKA